MYETGDDEPRPNHTCMEAKPHTVSAFFDSLLEPNRVALGTKRSISASVFWLVISGL